jgi:excisionase family DNA binding protein
VDSKSHDHPLQSSSDNQNCSVCKELFASLERFFSFMEDMHLQRASGWLTVDDIAKELKISKSIVYRLIRNCELEAVNVVGTNGKIPKKGHYRVKRSSLQKYLDAKIVKPFPGESTRLHHQRNWPKVKNYLGL